MFKLPTLILLVYKYASLHNFLFHVRIFTTVHWPHIGQQADRNLFPGKKQIIHIDSDYSNQQLICLSEIFPFKGLQSLILMHKIIINILEQHSQTCPQSLLSATISHEIFLIEFAWTFKLNPKLCTNTLIQILIWDSLGLQSHKIPRTLQYKCNHVLMFNYKNMYLVLMQQCLLHCSFFNYKSRVHVCFCSLESQFFLHNFSPFSTHFFT